MNEHGKKVKKFFFSTAIAMMLTIILLLLLAMGLYFLQWNMEKVMIGIIGIYIISCMTGGWIAGRTIKKQKYLWGALIGLLYFLVVIIFSVLSETGIRSQGVELFAIAVMCLGAGTIGGMIA